MKVRKKVVVPMNTGQKQKIDMRIDSQRGYKLRNFERNLCGVFYRQILLILFTPKIAIKSGV